MPYIRCPEQRACVASLSTLVVSLNGVRRLTNQVDAYTVIDWPNSVLTFRGSLGRWRHDSKFKRQLHKALRFALSGWQNADLFAAPPSGCGSAYASVPGWWPDYERRRRLNAPFPAVIAYFSYHIVAETDLCVAIWRIAVCQFSILALASFLACARDDSCS